MAGIVRGLLGLELFGGWGFVFLAGYLGELDSKIGQNR